MEAEHVHKEIFQLVTNQRSAGRAFGLDSVRGDTRNSHELRTMYLLGYTAREGLVKSRLSSIQTLIRTVQVGGAFVDQWVGFIMTIRALPVQHYKSTS